MIILDTNVVSEPLKPRPDEAVLEWLDRQAPATLFLTTIGCAELWAGIACLPAGRRRTQLQQAMAREVLPLFPGRILDFDQESALAFGTLAAAAQAAGHPVNFADCAIAAIATRHRFMLATRNVRDFRDLGIRLVNPWDAST
jgi:predicted nucleic acid-binding protein